LIETFCFCEAVVMWQSQETVRFSEGNKDSLISIMIYTTSISDTSTLHLQNFLYIIFEANNGMYQATVHR